MGPHICHGMVREVLWQYGEPVITDDYVSVDTWISMRPGDPSMSAFPSRTRCASPTPSSRARYAWIGR